MSELFGMVAMVLAVAGVVLNNRKLAACFYLWIVSNVISTGLHVEAELWSLVARDIILTLLAFEGIYKWKRKE